MPFNIDLHTHSFFSGDGVSTPEELIAAGRAKNLHGIAITDHNTCDAVPYLLDKGLMRLDGLPVNDFLILPAVEVTTADGHLLCIGATLPYLKGKPALEVCDIIHQRGGLAIPPDPSADNINIKLFAKLEFVRVINSWRIVEALEPLHILEHDVVRERFEYDEAPGVHVGFVKIFRLTPSWSFPDNKKYGGCRSWLKLPIPPTDHRFDPVLSEAEQTRRRNQFLKIVGAAEASAASGA